MLDSDTKSPIYTMPMAIYIKSKTHVLMTNINFSA